MGSQHGASPSPPPPPFLGTLGLHSFKVYISCDVNPQTQALGPSTIWKGGPRW